MLQTLEFGIFHYLDLVFDPFRYWDLEFGIIGV
jgi:hypothetical protein